MKKTNWLATTNDDRRSLTFFVMFNLTSIDKIKEIAYNPIVS